MKFHHIGIACKNIEEELKSIFKLHPNIKNVSEVVFDPLQNVLLCMITLEDGLNLELVSGNPIQKFLDKKISYYHICYEVEDIDKSIEHFQQNGAILFVKPQPAVLFGGKKVAFLLTSYGIVELLNIE